MKTVMQLHNSSLFLFNLCLCLVGNRNTVRADESSTAAPCSCGVSTPGDRVVGGQQAPDKLYPWLVALVPSYNYMSRYCDGSLISTKHVLTAFHCLSGINPSNVVARIGAYDFNQLNQAGSVIAAIGEFLIYEQTDGYYNDLAVAVLAQAVEFSATIIPICLPPQGQDYAGLDAVVAGWGETSYRGDLPRYPQTVTLPVTNTTACIDNLKPTGTIIRANELCAGDLQGTKDACQGDSGGPLMYFDNATDRYVQIGVVSFGVGCATKGFYGIYTNLSFYSDNLQAAIDYKGCVLT